MQLLFLLHFKRDFIMHKYLILSWKWFPFVVLPTILIKITELTFGLIWIISQTFSRNHPKMFPGMSFVITSGCSRNPETFLTAPSTVPFYSFVFYTLCASQTLGWHTAPDESLWWISPFRSLQRRSCHSHRYHAGFKTESYSYPDVFILLRIGEVCHLKYKDIDRRNMRIHITHDKNRSDRYAFLSKRALDILTVYWFEFGKPMDWLFPKQFQNNKPIDTFLSVQTYPWRGAFPRMAGTYYPSFPPPCFRHPPLLGRGWPAYH